MTDRRIRQSLYAGSMHQLLPGPRRGVRRGAPIDPKHPPPVQPMSHLGWRTPALGCPTNVICAGSKTPVQDSTTLGSAMLPPPRGPGTTAA